MVADIDTVDPQDARKACRADQVNCRIANGAIKYFLKKKVREDLLALGESSQAVSNDSCFVAFQRPVEVAFAGAKHSMHGRTFEEAFVYDNLEYFTKGELPFSEDLTVLTTAEDIRVKTYEEIRRQGFKKTEFALDMAAKAPKWRTPAYIEVGLKWLDKKLDTTPKAQAVPTDGSAQ